LGGIVLDINLMLPYLSGAGFMLLGFLFSMRWVKSEAPQQKMVNP
jgi:hypothetical protein